MYREDGLVLYANSFLGDMNHADVFGEISSDSENISPFELGNGHYSKSGTYVFRKDVRDGMVSFLNSLEEADVLPLPVWTEKNDSLDILTEDEWNLVENSKRKYDDVVVEKLSRCCQEAKDIMAPMFAVAPSSDTKTKTGPLKKVLNRLKK